MTSAGMHKIDYFHKEVSSSQFRVSKKKVYWSQQHPTPFLKSPFFFLLKYLLWRWTMGMTSYHSIEIKNHNFINSRGMWSHVLKSSLKINTMMLLSFPKMYETISNSHQPTLVQGHFGQISIKKIKQPHPKKHWNSIWMMVLSNKRNDLECNITKKRGKQEQLC